MPGKTGRRSPISCLRFRSTRSRSRRATPPIAYNASANTVQAALEKLANIGPGNVSVSGGSLPGTLTIRFTSSLGDRDVPQLRIAQSNTAATFTVATTTQGASGTDEI